MSSVTTGMPKGRASARALAMNRPAPPNPMRRRAFLLSLALLISALASFTRQSVAGERPSQEKVLEAMVPQGATVRGLTRPFDAVVDSQKVRFESGLEFEGRVLWLDQYFLDLRVPGSETYLKIPFQALVKLELKVEKKQWPVASATALGLTLGMTLPADDSQNQNRRSLQRMSLITSGLALGFVAGLFARHMLPTVWQEVPLEQARLGIRK